MFNKKEFKATSVIRYQFQKLYTLEHLVDRYIEQNKHEMAKRTQLEAEVQRSKAWDSVYEVYPNLKKETSLIYSDKGSDSFVFIPSP